MTAVLNSLAHWTIRECGTVAKSSPTVAITINSITVCVVGNRVAQPKAAGLYIKINYTLAKKSHRRAAWIPISLGATAWSLRHLFQDFAQGVRTIQIRRDDLNMYQRMFDIDNAPRKHTKDQTIDRKAEELLTRMERIDTTLTSFNELTLTPHNFDGSDLSWKALARIMCSGQLNYLWIRNLDITERAAGIWAEAISLETEWYKSRVMKVSLSDNCIGASKPNCIEAIVRVLLLLPELEDVSVIRNSITDVHISAISTLIKQHKKLRKISLSWNGIRDAKGVFRTLQCLNSSSRLVEVDMTYHYFVILSNHMCSYNFINREGQELLSSICNGTQLDIRVKKQY